MERMTGKTMDAYVEFCTLEDAMRAVEKHHRSHKEGRPSHIGQRVVNVSLASQAELMQDLFPFACGIAWNGANPEIQPNNHDEPWKNFKGFVSEEEMTMLAKHAKVPNRVSMISLRKRVFNADTRKQTPFSRACPQRPYECLISTLRKLPWHLTEHITISQRYAIFRATWDLVQELTHRLKRQRGAFLTSSGSSLSEQLLNRVVAAALRCPGFTPLMKNDLSSFANLTEAERREYGMTLSAGSWVHQYTVAPRRGIPHDVVEVRQPVDDSSTVSVLIFIISGTSR